MKKDVCILTNFRTGSTSLIQKLSQDLQLQNLWEYYGKDPAYADVAYQEDQNTFAERWPTVLSSSRSSVIMKVMGNQIGFDLDAVKEMSQHCNMIYLYRKDFLEQAKSWTAWLTAKDWEHHYGKEKEYEIDVTQEYFDAQTKLLVDNYQFMLDSYEIAPGTIMCYEDLFKSNPKRYARKNNWVNEPVLNTPFNTKQFEELK